MKKSRIIRVDGEFEDYLNRFRIELSNELGRPISGVEASEMLAKMMEKKKKEAEPRFGSDFHL